MVRLATSGRYDFKQHDPEDRWKIRQLRWMCETLLAEQDREVAKVDHQHWLSIATQAAIQQQTDTAVNARQHAAQAYFRILRATLPWESDRIGADATQETTEAAVSAYREAYGGPGDPRYEKMVAELMAELESPLPTATQKRRARERRRREREAAKRERSQAGDTDV